MNRIHFLFYNTSPKYNISKYYLIFLIVLFLPFQIQGIERRNKSENDESSYFFYPLLYKVPGLGAGEGGGATVVNLLGDGSTLSLVRIKGDIGVDSLIITDLPLFTQHFTLSAAYADGKKGGFAFYDRGPESPQEPAFNLKFKRSWARAFDLSLYLFDRQFELYSGFAFAFPEIDVSQSDLADFANFENKTSEEQEKEVAVFIKHLLMYLDLTNIVVTRRGVKFDLTDDRIDPRAGLRLQYENYGFEGEGLTNFKVDDYSLTTYMPNNDLSSVLVANIFYSTSELIKSLNSFGEYDYNKCIEDQAKNNTTEDVSSETICRGLIKGIKDFNETEAGNTNATSLGGPNRLRSYPLYRFHDKYSFFAGLEYRMYFMEKTTPFNWILEKGVFEALQLAFFYEVGQVSPTDDSALYRDFKYSTGVGLRLVFSSVVLRGDYATGKEGQETTLFIGYGF